MKILVVAALVALIHGSSATLLIKGPNQAPEPGEEYFMECWYSDSELNISSVHFEYFTHTKWYTVRNWIEVGGGYLCRFPGWTVYKTGERLLLDSSSKSGVPYRCASDAENATMADKYSEPLTLPYLSAAWLSWEGYSGYRSFPQDLKVRQGEDVVVKCSARSLEELSYYWSRDGDDWILPSSTLTLRKITESDGGKYTCTVEHPTASYLTKTAYFSVTVLPEDAPWYETSNGRLVLMTSAAAVCLVVFILSMSVFLCRRAKRAKTSKGPIDDRSQKKPIYKSSVESLPSTCADKQPLV